MDNKCSLARRIAASRRVYQGRRGPHHYLRSWRTRVTARQLARCWAALPRYPRCPATPNHVVIRSAARRNLAESRSRTSAVIAQPGPAVDSVDRRSCKLHPPVQAAPRTRRKPAHLDLGAKVGRLP